MYRNTAAILIHHQHKLLDLINNHVFQNCCTSAFLCSGWRLIFGSGRFEF
jgi:hypothetical protein